jgi:hypothetical protein
MDICKSALDELRQAQIRLRIAIAEAVISGPQIWTDQAHEPTKILAKHRLR